MRGLFNNLASGWLVITWIVAGIDAYAVMTCAGRTAPLISLRNPEADRWSQLAQAVTLGPFKGAFYNFSQSLGGEGACGTRAYTHQFGRSLAGMLNTPPVYTVYRLNQGIIGAPGAMLGGLGADTVAALRRFTP